MRGENKKIGKLLPLILILLFSHSLYSATKCKNPITEEDIKQMCDQMITGFKTDINVMSIEEKLVQGVLAKANIGDKGTFGLEKGYQVSRIQITLFCETEKKLLLDKLINLGDKQNRKIILVKSCQNDDRDKPGNYYGTVSVQIFLEEIDENKVDMKADRTTIKPEENVTISVKLSLAGCPVKDKTITLRKQGPGSLPNRVVTDENGQAEVQFKAEKEGKTKIEAIYENLSKKIDIITRHHLLWDMDCHIHFYQYYPEYPRLIDGYNDRWRSRVQFKDIPLSQLAEADLTCYPESSENPEHIKIYMKWLKIKKIYENHGSFYDERFTIYDGETLHYGSVSGKPTWIMGIGVQGEKLDFAEEEEKDLKMFIMVKMKSRTVMVSINEKSGVKTPWPVSFELRIKFPKEKILAGEPFILDLKEPHGSISHKNLEIRFTPKKN